MRTKVILITIVILAFTLRFVGISSNPPALYGDELTLVLDSNSLLKTGRDQTGASFPLTFNMREKSPGGYAYFSIPFIAIFGPTALGIRLLSVLSGVLMCPLIFLLGRKIFSQKVGLFAAGLMAVSPWSISISRGGFESNFGLFLALASIVSLLFAKEKKWLYPIAALAFVLSINTYQTFRLTLPIILLALFLLTHEVKKLITPIYRRYIITSAIILLIGLSISFYQTFLVGSETRFLNLNILSQPEITAQVTQQINFETNQDNLPRVVSRFFHNKVVEYSKLVMNSYLENFSPDFLFISGDKNPRHNMVTSGALYLVEIVTLGLGLLSLKTQKRKLAIILAWILVAPIPAALLNQTHFLRGSFTLPALILLSAIGLERLWTNKGLLPSITKILLILGILVQFIFLTEKRFFLSANEFNRFWSYPAKKVSLSAIEAKDRYNYVVISGKIDNAEFAYPVYAAVDPSKVIKQNNSKTKLGNLNFKNFDNVYIGSLPKDQVEKFLNSLPGSAIYYGTIHDKDYLSNYEIITGSDALPDYIIKRKDK